MTRTTPADDDFGVFGRAIEAYMWLYGNRLVATASWPNLFILVWGLFQFARTLVLLCCFLASYVLACIWFALPVVARWPLIGALTYIVAARAFEREWYFFALFAVHALFKILSVIAGDVRAREANLILAPLKGFIFAAASTYAYAESWLLRIPAIIIAILIVNRLFLHCLEGYALRELIVAQAPSRSARSRHRGACPAREYGAIVRLVSAAFGVTARQVAVSYFDAMTRVDDGPRIEEIRDEAGNLIGTREHGPVFSIGLSDRPSTHESNADAETEWELALSNIGAFVGLGRSREALGAGRIETEDEQWRNVLRPLASAAGLCIVIPSANPDGKCAGSCPRDSWRSVASTCRRKPHRLTSALSG